MPDDEITYFPCSTASPSLLLPSSFLQERGNLRPLRPTCGYPYFLQ